MPEFGKDPAHPAPDELARRLDPDERARLLAEVARHEALVDGELATRGLAAAEADARRRREARRAALGSPELRDGWLLRRPVEGDPTGVTAHWAQHGHPSDFDARRARWAARLELDDAEVDDPSLDLPKLPHLDPKLAVAVAVAAVAVLTVVWAVRRARHG